MKRCIKMGDQIKCSCSTSKCTSCNCSSWHLSCDENVCGCDITKCGNPHNHNNTGFCTLLGLKDNTLVFMCPGHPKFDQKASPEDVRSHNAKPSNKGRRNLRVVQVQPLDDDIYETHNRRKNQN